MSSKASKIGIIILAAGAATRMGQPKQLLHFKGESFIQKVIKTALDTNYRPIVIVLGAYYNEIKIEITKLRNDEIGFVRHSLDEGGEVCIVENQHWQQGISTSVKIGLERLLAVNPNVEAALFLLTDQPLLTTEHLLKIIHSYQSQATSNKQQDTNIIASFYNNRLGVPALFPKKYFDKLLQLTGDEGARKLLELHQAEVHAIAFPEGAFDVDTPENYEFLRMNYE